METCRHGRQELTTRGWLSALVAVAVALRVWQLDWGLPSLFHPDETYAAGHILDMLGGDFSGMRYHHPPLMKYLGWLLALPWSGWTEPGLVHLLRWVSAAAGTALVPATHALARRAGVSETAALLAAALVALSPLTVTLSRYAAPDMVMTLLLTASLASSSWGRGGLLLGLAVGSKYNALAGALAWAWRAREASRREVALGVAGGLAGLAVSFPMVWTQLDVLWDSLAYEYDHTMVSGHGGVRVGLGQTWGLFYLREAWLPGVGPLAAVAGVVGLRWVRARPLLLVLGAYLVVIELAYKVPPAPHRYLLPVAPILAVGAGAAWDALAPRWRAPLAALALAWPVVDTVALGVDMGTDSRDEAAAWLRETMPEASVARFGPGPYQPDLRGHPGPVQTLPCRRPSGIEEAEVVVVSSFEYARYLAWPSHFPPCTRRYRRLLEGELLYEGGPTWRTWMFHEPTIKVLRLPAAPGASASP